MQKEGMHMYRAMEALHMEPQPWQSAADQTCEAMWSQIFVAVCSVVIPNCAGELWKLPITPEAAAAAAAASSATLLLLQHYRFYTKRKISQQSAKHAPCLYQIFDLPEPKTSITRRPHRTFRRPSSHLSLTLLSRGQREVHDLRVLGKLHILQDNERTVHAGDGPVLHARLHMVITHNRGCGRIKGSHDVRHLSKNTKLALWFRSNRHSRQRHGMQQLLALDYLHLALVASAERMSG